MKPWHDCFKKKPTFQPNFDEPMSFKTGIPQALCDGQELVYLKGDGPSVTHGDFAMAKIHYKDVQNSVPAG